MIVTITKGSGITVRYEGKSKNFPAGSRVMYMGFYISQDYVSIFQGKGISVYYDGGKYYYIKYSVISPFYLNKIDTVYYLAA